MAELTVRLQVSQENLTGLFSVITSVTLVFCCSPLEVGSESPSDSLASSEEKSLTFALEQLLVELLLELPFSLSSSSSFLFFSNSELLLLLVSALPLGCKSFLTQVASGKVEFYLLSSTLRLAQS